MDPNRKLYRSKANRKLAGVCGGLAQYLNVDATVIRVLFVLLAVLGGSGLVLYLAMWIMVPNESLSRQDPAGPGWSRTYRPARSRPTVTMRHVWLPNAAGVHPLAATGTVEGQALVPWLPVRSRSAANSAAKDTSLVRRRTLNWPSARWPVSTMRRRYLSYSPGRTTRITGAP
jgi:phage shock protein C